MVALSIGVVTAAALVVWHEVGRNRQLGFMLLRQYEELLTQSREEKARDAEREAREEAENQKKQIAEAAEASEDDAAT